MKANKEKLLREEELEAVNGGRAVNPNLIRRIDPDYEIRFDVHVTPITMGDPIIDIR